MPQRSTELDLCPRCGGWLEPTRRELACIHLRCGRCDRSYALTFHDGVFDLVGTSSAPRSLPDDERSDDERSDDDDD